MHNPLRGAGHFTLWSAFFWAGLGLLNASGQGTEFHTALEVEWSDRVDGTWENIPGDNRNVGPDGDITVVSPSDRRFMRLHLTPLDGMTGSTARVPVNLAATQAVGIAERFLQDWSGAPDPDNLQTDTDGDSWQTARIAPYAVKVFDPSYRGGLEPAYLEFRVIADGQGTRQPGSFGRFNDVEATRDLGYLLVSLHEGDFPVPSFGQRGSAPFASALAAYSSSNQARIVRYGDSYAVVEDGSGNLLTTLGTGPFKIPAAALSLARQTFQGEFNSDTAPTNMPHGSGGPYYQPEFYESYAAFKSDYVTNEIYQTMRADRRVAAEALWGIEKGILPRAPEVWEVTIGARVLKLPGETVSRAFLDDERIGGIALANLDYGAAGEGLYIVGVSTGTALLKVESNTGVSDYLLRVVLDPDPRRVSGGEASTKSFTPGWQPWQKYYAAPDGYAGMARYSQLPLRSIWCDAVGCGPVAWAILFHWWDYHNVPGAYYSRVWGQNLNTFLYADAPGVNNEQYAYDHMYEQLHDLCDVICNPSPWSDEGATWPSDMIEAGPGWLWLPKHLYVFGGLPPLKFTYAWAWDISDTDWNIPATRIRSAVKNGRPAIIGLGWLWHYGVAYGYGVRVYKVTENSDPVVYQRMFKVNEGWGRANGVWYNPETFLGADIRPTQLAFP